MKWIWTIYILQALCIALCSCQMKDMPTVDKIRDQLDQYTDQEERHITMTEARDVYERVKNLNPESFLKKLKASADASPTLCYNDTIVLVEALLKVDIRALYMLDAWAKPPTGILLGSFNWLGSYSECLNVTFATSNTSEFSGRYCAMQVGQEEKGAAPPGQLPKSVTVGLCIPSSCSVDEIEYYIDLALDMANVSKAVRAFGGACQPLPSERHITGKGPKAMIALLSILGVFLVLGTLYDVCIYERRERRTKELKALESSASDNGGVLDLNAEVNVVDYTPLVNNSMDGAEFPSRGAVAAAVGCDLLLAFSVPRNLGKLFTVPPPGENNLAVIHGVRFISMTWVILGHTFAFIIYYVSNPVFALTLMNRWTFQAISNATVSVDSFFLLSGTLVAYLLLKEMEKNGSWNLRWGWVMFYVHRYWRLTAPYMLVVGFWTTLFQYTGSGPNWPLGNTIAGQCPQTWWTNLLYVNNIVEKNKQCMGWAWYLANDMQFYVISPLFLIFLYMPRGRKFGFLLMFATLMACWISTGLISAHDEAGMGIAGLVPQGNSSNSTVNVFNDVYIVPYTRIGPYLVGLFLGWALWKTKLNCKMHWVVALFGWAVATACALAIIYGPSSQINGPPATVPVAAFYNATNRTVWGACVAWVIFACINGYGGYVNSILCWPALVPLSRLTFMAYLVHPAVIFHYSSSQEKLFFADDYSIIYLFLGHLVMSYMVALVVSVALESPLMGIERALRRKDKK